MTCRCREYETCELCTSEPLKHLRCSRCRGTGVVDHCRDDYCTKTRVCPKCEGVRLDEQAAASVPSGDLRDDIDTVFWRYNADTPAQLAAFNRLVAAALRSEPAGHLDGGARSLDASEALQEARVQGMRKAMGIALRWIDREESSAARAVFDAAIEAVRKGER